MNPRKCEYDPDTFCYVCGKYTIKKSQKPLTPLIEENYQHYFQRPLIRSVWWAPAQICSTCYTALNKWSHGNLPSMQFGVPMIWNDPIEHKKNQCYFCVNHSIHGHNIKARHDFEYQSVPPHAEIPKPHSDTVPIPALPAHRGLRSADTNRGSAGTLENNSEQPSGQASGHALPNPPRRLTQENLNALIGELGLPAEGAALLGSRFKKWNLLAQGVKVPMVKAEERDGGYE